MPGTLRPLNSAPAMLTPLSCSDWLRAATGASVSAQAASRVSDERGCDFIGQNEMRRALADNSHLHFIPKYVQLALHEASVARLRGTFGRNKSCATKRAKESANGGWLFDDEKVSEARHRIQT